VRRGAPLATILLVVCKPLHKRDASLYIARSRWWIRLNTHSGFRKIAHPMRDTRPTPTLHDVAKRSGFSTATISRCLNFPNQVSEKTRDKVAAAIEELGYSPNFGARAMAAQRTNTVAAIIPTMENAIFARGIQAFQEELDDHGYNLMVASSSYQPDLEARQIRSLVARGADALLLIGHDRDPDIYRFLDTQKVPALVTWAFDKDRARPSIGFDNRAAMASMAREVLRFGHKRLALITAEFETNDRASARLAGVRDAMAEAGLMPDDLCVVTTPYGIESGAQAFAKLMGQSSRPTAVLCGNDVLAVGAVGQAREMGLDVPRDVSITGFDDIELAQVTHPKLATVHVPHSEMGRKAARTLIAALQDGAEIVGQELKAELRLRGSLGPAP
jgi:LacI family transcriptional regulator